MEDGRHSISKKLSAESGWYKSKGTISVSVDWIEVELFSISFNDQQTVYLKLKYAVLSLPYDTGEYSITIILFIR
jgi:hypothetical protein